MPTRRGTVYTISNNQHLVKKNKSKKNIKPTVIEEDCTICQELLNVPATPETPAKPVTTLNCGHKFHEECINRWMNSNQGSAHFCPLCRAPINQVQLPPAPTPAMQQEFAEIPIHERRLQDVVQYQTQSGTPVPFLGIVLCHNNIVRGLDLNTSLNLTTDNTLGQLKAIILGNPDNIISLLPTDFTCAAWNAASTFSRGFIQPSRRTIQIQDIRFTTPSMCSIPGFSDDNLIDNDDITLGELYRAYQQNARIFLLTRSSRNSNSLLVRNVYNRHVIFHNPNPDWDGVEETNYFLNPNNPIIPEPFRAVDGNQYATFNSIAWLGINIDCTRSGGKTRKTRKNKRKRSNKRKTRK